SSLSLARPCAFFFSSRRRHTRFSRDWSSDVCSSDLLRLRVFSRLQVLGRMNHATPEPSSPRDTVDPSHQIVAGGQMLFESIEHRSEERRVGKEWTGATRLDGHETTPCKAPHNVLGT